MRELRPSRGRRPARRKSQIPCDGERVMLCAKHSDTFKWAMQSVEERPEKN